MKIGIITFWESTDNYGQVLQLYALQQTLIKMGHDPFLIRYSLRASLSSPKRVPVRKLLSMLLIVPFFKFLKNKYNRRKDSFYKKTIERKNLSRKFADFRNRYIIQSEIVYNSFDELVKNPPEADCYITGSDQVWTMLLDVEGNRAYYLDFGSKKVKRLSYAASFARPYYPSNLLPFLKNLLIRFDAISVREQEGVDICKNIGCHADLVADPTLLLSKYDYLMFCKSECKQKEGTFIYSINIRRPQDIYWEIIKKNVDYQHLIITTSSGNIPGREIIKGIDYKYLSIPEWIKTINESSLVVTTSFHGVVFCLIMNTNFVYVPLKKSRAIGNGRVKSLLSYLGLEKKICYNESDFDSCVSCLIDWDKVVNKIESIKQSSVRFLDQSLACSFV